MWAEKVCSIIIGKEVCKKVLWSMCDDIWAEKVCKIYGVYN